MKEVNDENYTSIIPTAYLTAYPRTFTDIPYTKEIFAKLEKMEGLEVGEDLKVPRLAPELEARYKLIDKLLKESGAPQVLELAAGLSTRGLTLASSLLHYAELDLMDMADMKRVLLGQVASVPSNLHIIAGNALKSSDLKRATADFDSTKPLVVINEGLLRYLSFTEKAEVAMNIHGLLKQFGGLWITCDITPKRFLNTQDTVTKPGINKDLIAMTGKDFNATMFEDNAHATKFFEKLGFTVEIHPFAEIRHELTSPQKLKISEEEVTRLLGPCIVAVMRLAK